MSQDEARRLAQEIKKLPRERCPLCGITQAKPAMDNGRCRNLTACEMRRRREAERKQQREEKRT